VEQFGGRWVRDITATGGWGGAGSLQSDAGVGEGGGEGRHARWRETGARDVSICVSAPSVGGDWSGRSFKGTCTWVGATFANHGGVPWGGFEGERRPKQPGRTPPSADLKTGIHGMAETSLTCVGGMAAYRFRLYVEQRGARKGVRDQNLSLNSTLGTQSGHSFAVLGGDGKSLPHKNSGPRRDIGPTSDGALRGFQRSTARGALGTGIRGNRSRSGPEFHFSPG